MAKAAARWIAVLVLAGAWQFGSPFRISLHSPLLSLRGRLGAGQWSRAASGPSSPRKGFLRNSERKMGCGRLPRLSRRGTTFARGTALMGLTMSQDGVANFLDDLLLQRAVQTQLFYFQEFRDGFKRQWLENFLDHEGLMNYHGFGGLKVSADEYLTSMFNSAPVEHEVKMSWGSRLAGGSKDNPYLQQQPTYNYYMETVHPQKICKGVMEIREQLKLEWITDLPVMREEDDLFKDAFQRLKEAQEDAMMNLDSSRSTRTLSRRPGSKEKMDKQKQDEEKYGKWDWDSYDAVGGGDDVGDVPAGLEEVARMQRAQEATGGMIQFDGPDQEEAAGLSLVVFFFGLDVRDDLNTVGLRSLQSSTPLRSKSYDVLKKAATYIAVKRLMADWARTRGMEGALQWFSNQWEDKYRELFQRDSGRHLADRFLSDLVSRPAVAVKLVESDSLHMVTPQELAMAILEERARVVEAFRDWLETDAVEDGHTALQRELLVKSFETPGDAGPASQEAEQPSASGPGSGLQTENTRGESLESIWKPEKKKPADDGAPGG